MEANQFQELLNKSFNSFQLNKTNISFIHVIRDEKYIIGHIIFIQTHDNPSIIYFNGKAEIFKKHKAFGILKDVLINPALPFNTMIFCNDSIHYETSRKHYLENCIEETWSFGTKCFLPKSHFRKITDPAQLEFLKGIGYD